MALLCQDFNAYFALSLQKKISCQLKRWAGIHRSADIGSLFRSRESFGLGLTSVSTHLELMQLVKCSILDQSDDSSIKLLFAAKVKRDKGFSRVKKFSKSYSALAAEVKLDNLFPTQDGKQGLGAGNFDNNPSRADFRASLLLKAKKIANDTHTVHAMSLKMQGVWNGWIGDTFPFDLSWKSLIYGYNDSVAKFVLNATINSLVTPDLLNIWGLKQDRSCPLCDHTQCTQAHILSSCSWSLYGDRYTWRHDSVLKNLELALRSHIDEHNTKHNVKQVKIRKQIAPLYKSFVVQTDSKKKTYGVRKTPLKPPVRKSLLDGATDWKMLVDYNHDIYIFPVHIFPTTKRPDILLYSDSLKLVILSELTCPMEEGMEAARIRKIARYKSMTENIPKFSGYTAELFTVEVGARGFVRSHVRHWLRKIGFSNHSATSLYKAISGVSARCSFAVYLARSSKSWDKDQSLVIAQDAPTFTTAVAPPSAPDHKSSHLEQQIRPDIETKYTRPTPGNDKSKEEDLLSVDSSPTKPWTRARGWHPRPHDPGKQ